MTTADKLERYEFALKDWVWRVKAWSCDPSMLRGEAPREPSLEGAGLTDGLEVWAAMKIRARYVQPPKNSTAPAQS